MAYRIFFICLLLGLTSGVLYEFNFVARFLVLKKGVRPRLKKSDKKVARPPHICQRTPKKAKLFKRKANKKVKKESQPRKGSRYLVELKRRQICERAFVIFLDIAYFLIVAIIFVALSLKYSFYEPRLYMFLGVILGMAIYCKTLHKVIAFLTNKVYNRYSKRKGQS